MQNDVPPSHRSPSGDSLSTSRRAASRAGRRTLRAGVLLLGSLSTLLFTSSALGATATVGLGTAASFSVLGGSTVTNTGPTTMFGDLGLSPGSSVTGAPHVLGATHVDDAVAIGAKSNLTTAYNDAASRPTTASLGSELAGRAFSPGVYTAKTELKLSSGSVTLNAQGDPNAVFIFQIGSTLVTGSNTSVVLTGGAQACNVFWQVGSSATLGTGTSFIGTVMAYASIAAQTAATIHGRLLAETAAVTLDTNTITNSNCASSSSGSGGGTETTTPAEATTLAEGAALAKAIGVGEVAVPKAVTGPRAPLGSKSTGKRRRRHGVRHAIRRHVVAHRALPHARGAFTG